MGFFDQAERRNFPDIPEPAEDFRLEIIPYLESCNSILPFFDLMGVSMKPAKTDMGGNVEKIRKRRETNLQKFVTLDDILLEDVAMKMAEVKTSTTIAIIWLNRALLFCAIFLLRLARLARETKPGEREDIVNVAASDAYEKSLKPYHGWFAQKIFKVCFLGIPYRKDFFISLSGQQKYSEEKICDQMEAYATNIERTCQFLTKRMKLLSVNTEVGT